MKNTKIFYLVAALVIVMMLTGCSSTKVTRMDTGTITDASGKWNDTDSRSVADAMIDDCLSKKWLTDFTKEMGENPVVIIGNVRNRSTEHISENTFIKDIERYFINSGMVDVVVSGAERSDIRDERGDQQEFSSEETRKKWQEEIGADFMLSGMIDSIIDSADGVKYKYYQVDLELINLETNKKVWIGSHKIKKMVEKSSTGW